MGLLKIEELWQHNGRLPQKVSFRYSEKESTFQIL